MKGRWLSLLATATVAGFVAGCGSAPRPAAPRSSAVTVSPTAEPTHRAPSVAPQPTPTSGEAGAAPCVSGTCWVAVNVATAWVQPWYPRPVDEPSLASPADPVAWLQDMTLAQRQWLTGRLETQAVYGVQVIVTGHWGSWTHVAIPSQPTNRDSRGYPGWIPTAQLTSTAPATASVYALTRENTWLWSGWTDAGVSAHQVMLASYDTILPVVRVTGGYVVVALIGGQDAAVSRADVTLHAAGESWGATRAGIVAEASKFLGLPYLWGGTSGFGFDCSGFTYSVYRAFGITISRDADQQAVYGTPVDLSALAPGDLVFFRDSSTGPVGHVGLYAGNGNMIDAPHTGAEIRIEPVSSFPYYAGARRYLTS